MEASRIRNFSIIAHIDHGKSTLADRLLEQTGTLTAKQMQAQVLDDMDLERERGITIKAHAVNMSYSAEDGQAYSLNLIDTPGHVDFTYEVSRSLAACEGALLVVDATQGVEAQTVSNVLLAMERDLTIIPIINKIDMPSAQIEAVQQQILDLIGPAPEDILLVSAKQGTGIDGVLKAIIERIPCPSGKPEPLRALIFDSLYDAYRGVICFIRVVDGRIEKGMQIRFHATGQVYEAEEVGLLCLGRHATETLETGEVGYLIAGVRNISDAGVGDTIVPARRAETASLPGYQMLKPMVFSGLYPVNAEDYDDLRHSMGRLQLNDAAFSYEPETSVALGFGFRCGFLGLLHMEIIQERLEREYGIEILATVPNVRYEVRRQNGSLIEVDNPSAFPNVQEIAQIYEPILTAQILAPSEYVGNIMKLLTERRGTYQNTEYLTADRVRLTYQLPLAEIVSYFYDKLKSVTRGYASFDYEFNGMQPAQLVKVDILINGDSMDALSTIIHRDKAYAWGRDLSHKLRELIPRQLFEVIIQAAIGSRVISREVVRPLRKNVLSKCYGGDITRKRKLLERQKEGKKRMKQMGKVQIPQEAFLAALKVDS
ncbi:MAG: translation elongation factor 4 [bacterium]|nr:translation elongation factor 4 [bacterium]